MEKLQLQLANLIKNTYLDYFLFESQRLSFLIAPSQKCRTHRNEFIATTECINTYYSKNESIKYLSMIKLHLPLSFSQKIYPILIDDVIYERYRHIRKRNKIQLRNEYRKEGKTNKEANNNIIKEKNNQTRNKSSSQKLTKCSKQNNDNQVNQGYFNENVLSLGMSLPVYQDYSKVFTAYVYEKYGKLINSKANMKETDKLSIFRKYLMETKNMITKKSRYQTSLKTVKQSQSREMLISKEKCRSNLKVQTNSISQTSQTNNNMLINSSINKKRNQIISFLDCNRTQMKNSEVIKSSKETNDLIISNNNKNVNAKHMLMFCDKGVGNDQINHNMNKNSSSISNLSLEHEVDSSLCKINLYDVIFMYKRRLPSLSNHKASHQNSQSQQKIRELNIKSTFSDESKMEIKSKSRKQNLPQIKLKRRRNEINKREVYFISKLENAFIKKCVFNQIELD